MIARSAPGWTISALNLQSLLKMLRDKITCLYMLYVYRAVTTGNSLE